jgi:alkaline phosphatase
MKLSILFGVILAAVSTTSEAQSTARPRLIVVISVDQFSADLFTEYRPLFKAGLHRLQTGVVFSAGYQSHAATETCPGHSTILTGSHPARTGIIANEWYDQSLSRADKKVYCSEDPSLPGSSSSNYTVSAQFLKAQTLGDRLKAANPKSRVISVAGKDRAAIMMGGHSIDQVWFWSGKAFVTLNGVDQAKPAIVDKVNATVAAEIAKPDLPLLPAPCRVRSMSVAVADKTVGVLSERKAGDWQRFRASPAFDRATTDVAIGLIRELRLGAGEAPDVLSIGLSATDYVGHTFGTEGAEMCTQLLDVDDNVGRILAALDATHQPYVVVLTADHGGHDLPERNNMHGFLDAARVDPALLPVNMSKQLAAEFNLPDPVLLGVAPFGDIYLARGIPDNVRSRVLETAKARYLAHPQVAAVFTSAELRRMPAPSGPADEWSLAERFRAGFDRSGQVISSSRRNPT